MGVLFCCPGGGLCWAGDFPYHVYVMLGLHMNFYHSWRGDEPDETGFGTDIRVVREVLRLLNEANERGWDARVYWDFEIHWTVEQILPRYAPDLLEAIRARVERGLDEVLPGPYNNGLTSAQTEREWEASVRWAAENPFHSGLKQVFGRMTPVFRPQESFLTCGQLESLKAHGIVAVILPYSGVPFTAFSNFIPPLPIEDRFHVLWLKTSDTGMRLPLLPSISVPDLVDHGSLEALMLRLRTYQVEKKLRQDLLIHLNFDADAETWLPIAPGVPNLGGISEYIRAVNRYDWARFTTPGAYLETHEPVREILVRQDLADGAFDGYSSWTEKFSSTEIWSDLEKSRLFSYQADALSHGQTGQPDASLWEGVDSAFFQRLIGLSATHFGMATPRIHEVRRKVAREIACCAKARAHDRLVAWSRSARERFDGAHSLGSEETEYVFTAFPYPTESTRIPPAGLPILLRIPVVLSTQVDEYRLVDGNGRETPFSVVRRRDLSDGFYAADLIVIDPLGEPSAERTFFLSKTFGPVRQEAPESGRSNLYLENAWIGIRLSESDGIEEVMFEGERVGGRDFWTPFVTYRPEGEAPIVCAPRCFEVFPLEGERWQGIQRGALRAEVAVPVSRSRCEKVGLQAEFTLPMDAPFFIADVSVEYPYTPSRTVLSRMQQSLVRPVDVGWLEVAPFALNPAAGRASDKPVRVWKHNALGVTSWYELKYDAVNPKQRELDSFNNHVTAGWVALSDGERGILIAQDASVSSNPAFAPMRLRMEEGRQRVQINPFGSYAGRQFDFSHMGGSGLGSRVALLLGAQFHPSAPSYNGRRMTFSLLLAPYSGEEPPQDLKRQAAAFYYPCGVRYQKTPVSEEVLTPEQMNVFIVSKLREKASREDTRPLPVPELWAFGSAKGCVHLVWDHQDDIRTEGVEFWHRKGSSDCWERLETTLDPLLTLCGLDLGEEYGFRCRSVAGERRSEFSREAKCRVGGGEGRSLLSQSGKLLREHPVVLLWILESLLRHYLTVIAGGG